MSKLSKKSKAPRHVIVPEEDFELLDRGDFIEYEYLRAHRARKKRRCSVEENKFLAEHDRLEARIQQNPKAVLEQARDAIDEGTVLLLKLIRSRKLRYECPKDFGGSSWDKAMNCFTSRLGFLNRQFVRISEDRAPEACFHLWYQTLDLAGAVVRLCEIFPEEFRGMAESSLFMPSLRARNPKFTCNSEAIGKAIHLAEKHPAPEIHDNRTRIGALCHRLIADFVAEVQWARRQKENFEEDAKFSNSQELIPAYVHPDWRELYEESWDLPELPDNAEKWWKNRIQKMAKREFCRVMKNPKRNPVLREELNKITDNGTESAMWHEFEKNCLNKLNQISGQPSGSA